MSSQLQLSGQSLAVAHSTRTGSQYRVSLGAHSQVGSPGGGASGGGIGVPPSSPPPSPSPPGVGGVGGSLGVGAEHVQISAATHVKPSPQSASTAHGAA